MGTAHAKKLGPGVHGPIRRKLHIYVRTTKKRFPIKPLFGPAIPQMMGIDDVVKKLETVAQKRLDKRLDQEIRAVLMGYDKPGRRR